MESGVLKNAIESANYCPDSRKRSLNFERLREKGFLLLQAGCGASTMAVFQHTGLYFLLFIVLRLRSVFLTTSQKASGYFPILF